MDTHRFAAPVWSVFRVVIGLLFSLHGAASVLGVFGGNQGSGKAIELGLWPSWYAGLIQLACGILVMIGLLTRPAAVLASGSMAYAYFVVHQPNAVLPIQNGGVTPALYAWTFLIIAVLGAGPWSLDALLRRRPEAASTTPSPKAQSLSAQSPSAQSLSAQSPTAQSPTAQDPAARPAAAQSESDEPLSEPATA
jgi:putative oxidoreductase